MGRYEIKNGNNGNLPHTPDPLKADCEELFYTLDVLLSTLGQPIFESISIGSMSNSQTKPANSTIIETTKQNEAFPFQTVVSNNDPILFYCKVKSANAQGYYDDDGFVLLTNSLVRKSPAPSLSKWAISKREEMLSENKLIEYNDESYKLIEDQLFKTPSGAAQIVTGRPTNGWVEWKNEAGETLSDIYR